MSETDETHIETFSVALIRISYYATSIKKLYKRKNQLSWVYLERTIQHVLLDKISCGKVQPWCLSMYGKCSHGVLVCPKPGRCYR